MKFMLRELTVSGSYFDAGYQIGVFGKKEIKRILEKRKEKIQFGLKNREKVFKHVQQILQKEAPNQIELLQGIATGAEVSFNELFAKNCPEIIETGSGCTTVTIKNKNNFFIIHNEDDDDWLTEESYCLVHYKINNGFRFSSFNILGDLPNAFTWNMGGIFFAMDYQVPFTSYKIKKMPRQFESSLLVEKTTMETALDFLKRNKSASSSHYLISDLINKKVVSVEKADDVTSVKKINDLFIHTNHYIHSIFKGKYSGEEDFGTSLERTRMAHEILNKNDSQQIAVKKIMSKLKRPLQKGDSSKTFATVLCDILTKTITIYSPNNKAGLKFKCYT